MNVTEGTFSAELNRTLLEWDLDAGTLHVAGRRAAMFWVDPSLLRMLQPLADELGAPLFRLLVAHESSVGSAEDYNMYIKGFGTTFEESFLGWGRAVGSAGWGSLELPMFDRAACRAVVRVNDPWELRMQQAIEARWGCPFLFGKVIGIFSLALGVNCWADEIELRVDDQGSAVEFHVHPSDRTIPAELAELRRLRADELRRPLDAQVALIQRQEEAIRAMATPILQVWDGVLALPIIGVVDSRRAGEITAGLLEAVVRMQARYAIIDMTGIDVIDATTAHHFLRIFRGVRLLGAECLVCGIRPAVAQAMILNDSESGAAGAPPPRIFGTMQAALQAVIAGRR